MVDSPVAMATSQMQATDKLETDTTDNGQPTTYIMQSSALSHSKGTNIFYSIPSMLMIIFACSSSDKYGCIGRLKIRSAQSSLTANSPF